MYVTFNFVHCIVAFCFFNLPVCFDLVFIVFYGMNDKTSCNASSQISLPTFVIVVQLWLNNRYGTFRHALIDSHHVTYITFIHQVQNGGCVQGDNTITIRCHFTTKCVIFNAVDPLTRQALVCYSCRHVVIGLLNNRTPVIVCSILGYIM